MIGFSDARLEKEQLVQFYQRSKLVLNLGRSLSFENKRFLISPSTPGPRTYEAAAAGALQVFHEDTYEIRRYYTKEEIPSFSNRKQFEELVDTYIDNGALRIETAKKAQARTMADHTYGHRIRQALGILKENGILSS